jgi:hypothetical protein
MSRAAWWRLLPLIVVSGFAGRAMWLAWQYYFAGAPRYRVESAMIAFVIVGAIVVALRRDNRRPDDSGPRDGGPSLEARDDRDPRDAPASLAWLPLCILAAVSLYHRAITIGFLSDDYTLRAMAQSDTLGSTPGWFFRPVPLLLWRGILAVVDTPAALHVLNLVLHGVNAFLVAALGRAMGMRREAALGAAALFLTFPALPEAVVWAAGIQDVLMTTMALGAVVVSARGEPGSVWRTALVCGLLIVGFGSKETAVCIPVLIALCCVTRERARRDRMLYAAIAGVTAIYLAIRLPMGIGSDYFSAPTRYFFKQMIVIAFGTLAAPWRTPASSVERWLTFGAVGLTVVLLVHACLTWRRSERRVRRDVRLSLWVLASVAPVFSFFFVGPTLEGSRYLYLAACAWTLVVADLIDAMSKRVQHRARVFGAAIAAIVVIFTVSVQREIGVWRQAAELRDHVLAGARRAIDREGCVQPIFSDVPDSVNGAYVFRNGFSEALAAPDLDDSRPDCTFTWRGDGFARSR